MVAFEPQNLCNWIKDPAFDNYKLLNGEKMLKINPNITSILFTENIWIFIAPVSVVDIFFPSEGIDAWPGGLLNSWALCDQQAIAFHVQLKVLELIYKAPDVWLLWVYLCLLKIH